MKLRDVPARQGVLWVRSGFRVFFKRPLAYAALFAGLLLVGLVLLALPYVGPVLVLAGLPLASLGFMIATRIALLDKTPLPAVFTAPLRVDPARRRALLQLGALYAVATFGIVWIADIADGGRFRALQTSAAASAPSNDDLVALLSEPRLQAGMWLRFGLAALLSLPFWHAPALVHWGGFRAAQALFASTLACWRNRGAFVVYGLTWFSLLMLFGVLADTLLLALGQSAMVTAAAMPVALLCMTVFYASLFFTYVDCFEHGEGGAATAATAAAEAPK